MMRKSFVKRFRMPHNKWLIAVFVFVWLAIVHAYTLFNVSTARMLRGVVLLEDDRQVLLTLPDGRSCPVTARKHSFSTGFFVNGSGLVQTRWHHPELLLNHLSQDSLRTVLSARLDSAQNRYLELKLLLDEMDYYKRTHTVYDEGYNQILQLNESLAHESDSVSSLVDILTLALAGDDIDVSVDQQLKAYYRPTASDSLLVLDAQEVDEQHCRLLSGETPDGAYIFNTTSLRWWGGRRMAFGYLREPLNSSDSSAFIPSLIVLDSVSSDVPLPVTLSGAPVVDQRAHLRAVCLPAGWQEAGGFSINPAAWWRSIRQSVSAIFSDVPGENPSELLYESCRLVVHRETSLGQGREEALFTGVVGEGDVQYGRLDYSDGSHYEGFLHEGLRSGRGVYVDVQDQCFEGEWECDTLPAGIRMSPNARYVGDFDALLRPSGEGVLTGSSYYEGEWSEGKRHGFGIALVPGKITSIGVWRNDAFRGERIVFNSDRVYGIDIARYQHELGSRTFPILWKSLRLVNLGVKYKKNIDGSTSFPISFCYIKASQGVKTTNQYNDDDATNARKYGIKVGQYHFFSPMSGKSQAEWFLQNASLRKGDLPPMLDVELQTKQIEAMGGSDAMLREMVEWVRIVKARCHTNPVLYLNQSFVDKYMVDAPQELIECPVWVARYSEFRPYVRLAFWQLSDDGRVLGIRNKVDIDIFNGSVEQFESFVREHSIK